MDRSEALSLWFRIGPFGISSRGRASAHVGPVSVSGGGRRIRPGPTASIVFAIALLVGALILYWEAILITALVALPVVIGYLLLVRRRGAMSARIILMALWGGLIVVCLLAWAISAIVS
jgi:hypothetical protein